MGRGLSANEACVELLLEKIYAISLSKHEFVTSASGIFTKFKQSIWRNDKNLWNLYEVTPKLISPK